MKIVTRTTRFRKSFKLMLKRGKNPDKLEKVMELLANGLTVPEKYRDHKLTCNFNGSRELHIEPDWLLVYKISNYELILEDTGTHADIFGK